jgi:hypothetical protein
MPLNLDNISDTPIISVTQAQDGCECIHRSELPEPPPSAVLCAILDGKVTTRGHVEQLLGEPSYVRCARCPGHDVEYLFETGGALHCCGLTLLYAADGAVLSITAHVIPDRAEHIRRTEGR